MGVDVHRHTDPLQQFGQSLEGEAHHRAADVVGVVVGDQHAGQVHAVGLEGVEQIAGGVGGVDHHRLAGLAVTDEVGEVAHLLGDHVAGGEVAAGQQLPEVEAVVCETAWLGLDDVSDGGRCRRFGLDAGCKPQAVLSLRPAVRVRPP